MNPDIDIETVITDAIDKASLEGQTIKTKYQEALELIRAIRAIAEKEQIKAQKQEKFDSER